MSATEVLRRLLDERGVEWTDGGMFHRTHWVIDGVHHTAFEQDGKLYLQLSIGPLTPEQAIAATLGADANPTQAESSVTCHDVWDVELTGRLRFQCSECGAVSLEITPRFCPACGRKVVEPTKNDVDVEVERMSITDELREWFKDRFFMANGWQEIHDIADRIDAEHDKALNSVDDAYDSGYTSTRTNGLKLRRTQMQFTDEQQRFIDEHYQLLPKDADGEYIHVGDVMEWVRYEDDDPTIVRKVSAVGADVFFAWSDEQGRYAQYEACAYRHYHKPTVEDVLREFGIDWEHESDCEDRAALLKEYATKLQLKEDE